jgi:hypothetical protein
VAPWRDLTGAGSPKRFCQRSIYLGCIWLGGLLVECANGE